MKRLLVILLLLGAWRADADECVARQGIAAELVIDASGSMADFGRQGAAASFGTSLLQQLRGTGFLQWSGAFQFCTGTINGPTTSIGYTFTQIEQWVANTAFGGTCGGTQLFYAITVGANDIRTLPPAGLLKLLVVISDGEDDGSTGYTEANARASITSNITTELISITGSTSPSFDRIANGANIKSRASSPSDLNNLVAQIVDRTCTNFKPVARINPVGNLDLGRPGFRIDFNGSTSSDRETAAASLGYGWRLIAPTGPVITGTGQTFSHTFTDANIGNGWRIELTVTDAAGAASNPVSQTFNITGSAPSITIASPPEVNVGDVVTMTASPTTDTDGGNLTFTWTLLESPPRATWRLPGPSPVPADWSTSSVAFTTVGTDSTKVGPNTIGLWRFQCVAQDNEGDRDTKVASFHVKNRPPTFTLTGPALVRVGTEFRIETGDADDPDGGPLTYDWDVVQSPDSSSIGVQSDYRTGTPSLTMTGGATEAGTFIFRLRVKDDEGETVEHLHTVVIDADPTVAITGPAHVGFLTEVLLRSGDSVDPDSPCPTQADRCHTAEPGRSVEGISRGIVAREWTLLEVPSGQSRFVPGSTSDVLGIGGGEDLRVPAGRLPAGTWVFQLEIRDGEGNTAVTTHRVDVIDPDLPPLAITMGPVVQITGNDHLARGEVQLDASWSFDLDNLIGSQPLPGITAYAWSPLLSSSTCARFAPTTGRLVTLFANATLIPPDCFGYFLLLLSVTDDDIPARTGTNLQEVTISDCANTICIDSPTTVNPRTIELSDVTDIEITYHVNSALYGTPFCLLGCYARIEIFPVASPATIVFTAEEANPMPVMRGVITSFNWDGRVIGGGRPARGLYTTRITIVDYLFSPGGEVAVQTENIKIEVADPTVATTSDTFLSLPNARAGTDDLHIDYAVTGGITLTELRFRVFRGSTEVFTDTRPPGMSGSFTWDGHTTSPTTFIDPGEYELVIEVRGAAGLLGTSPRHRFTAFDLDLDLDGVAEADEVMPGADLAVDAMTMVNAKVKLRPSGMTGDIRLREDGGPLLGPAARSWTTTGVDIPAGSANPESVQPFSVDTDTPDFTHLVATYLPPGAPARKETRARMRINPTKVDLTAPCSADARETAPGIFAARRTRVGPVVFAQERFEMRRLHLKANRRIQDVILRQTAGLPADVAVFVALTTGAVPTEVALPFTFPTALYTMGKLDLDVFIQARGHAPVTLEAAIVNTASANVTIDQVKVRMGDQPSLVGQSLFAAPHLLPLATANVGEPVEVGVDPFLHDERRGLQGHVYVVPRKTMAGWVADQSLVDATGGAEAITISPGAIGLTGNRHVVWPAATLPGAVERDFDVVIDFGDCTAGAATDGRLDPEDLFVRLDPGPPALTVVPPLVAGGAAVTTLEFGNDFEEGGAGAVCTPAEAMAGAVCVPGPNACAPDGVCVDSNADGTAHCTPLGGGCAAGQTCVNTDNDEVAHCRPAAARFGIPAGYDGLASTIAGGFRVRNLVVHPTAWPGVVPLVVIAHGRHEPFFIRLTGERWHPVGLGITSDQNYRGHRFLQEHLAGHGYATVSVDLDEALGFTPLGSYGYPDVPDGINLRGWILLKNIEAVLANPALGPHIDRTKIYLVGHSRGAEAVLAAWQIMGSVGTRGPAASGAVGADATIMGFGQGAIKTVVSIAPVSFINVAPPLGATPFLLVYGSSDGDVYGGFNRRAQPFRHVDRAAPLRAAIVQRGANHNFFNTSWPDDDHTTGPDPTVRPEQEALARAYVLAWLRTVEGRSGYRAYFTNPPSRLRPGGLGGREVYGQWRVPGVTVIDDFETGAGPAMSGGGSVAMTTTDNDEASLVDVVFGSEDVSPNRFSQETRGGLFSWTAPAVYTMTPAAPVDLRPFRSISFRVAQEPLRTGLTTGPASGPLTFTIRLEDGAGNGVTLSSQTSTAIAPVYEKSLGGAGVVTSAIFQTVRIDLDRFTVDGAVLDLATIARIQLGFGNAPDKLVGRIAIDDVELEPR
jgi:hypothetical protein